jgi:hypothetical protein
VPGIDIHCAVRMDCHLWSCGVEVYYHHQLNGRMKFVVVLQSVKTHNYGVEADVEEYSNCFERVIVPPFDFDITDQQKQYLKDNFNPLQSSDNEGVDIYIAVKL